MNKVIVIGIDGMDPCLVERWLEFMPHFKMIRDKGSFYAIQSTYPPDSICAWTSIFTGRNPGAHGLLDSIDYLSQKKMNFEHGYNLEGKTFWDIASSRGKKVCIINPFLAYPAWEVNGVMVSGPVFGSGKTSAYPQEILDRLPFPPLGGWVDFPGEKALKEFILRAKDNTQRLADTSLRAYKQIPSDLFFLTFLTLDRIQHFSWRFTDKEDYTYPGENPFADTIREFYILFDRIVGNFMDVISKDTFLLVLSDHGHRRRCTKYLNLNEFLRKREYLSVNASGVTGSSKKLIEKTKVFTLRTFHKLNLQDFMYKIARLIPHRKTLRKSLYLLDKEKSLAYVYENWGTNSFGGIRVKKGDHYEALRSKIIGEFESLNESLRKKSYNGRRGKRIYTVVNISINIQISYLS
jgi:predicted AlkP superfamily phosphohydrolase/phosphomutase